MSQITNIDQAINAALNELRTIQSKSFESVLEHFQSSEQFRVTDSYADELVISLVATSDKSLYLDVICQNEAVTTAAWQVSTSHPDAMPEGL